MFEIHLAEKEEFEAVRGFYHLLIERMEQAECKPGWKKGIYPSDGYLQEAIGRRELYVGIQDGEYAASMIVNHNGNEGYRQAHWQIEAGGQEVTVIHALGVLPSFHGTGLSRIMVGKAISGARDNRQKALRLDVLKGNVPAERLYVKMGFRYVDTVRLFYEDTGLTDYLLYEYLL